MPRPRPTELELQILSILWEQGPLTVRAVRECMPDGKDRAYTTVLTLVQIMEKKGFVGHTRDGQTHVYHPLVTRQQVLRPLMRNLLRNVFRGSRVDALQCLLETGQLEAGELVQLRKLIREAGEKPRGKS